jgi:hypothetical protein
MRQATQVSLRAKILVGGAVITALKASQTLVLSHARAIQCTGAADRETKRS